MLGRVGRLILDSNNVLATLQQRIEEIRQERDKYRNYLMARIDTSLKSYDIAIAELEYVAGLLRKEHVSAPVVPKPVVTDWDGQLRHPISKRKQALVQPVVKDLDVNQQILMKSIQQRDGKSCKI